MTDLETELRAMLRTRADDITTLPERVLPATGADVVVLRPGLHRRRTNWLVAATVTAVLAIAAAVFAASDRDRSGPPTTQHTTSSATPTPTPTSHAPRKVNLAWFGMRSVPGFDRHLWLSDPGYRTLAVRARADQGVPVGCNGCEMASDYVVVFDRGAFDAKKYGVTMWTRTAVSGHSAYVGTMPWYGAKDHIVPTIAWQFRPGE